MKTINTKSAIEEAKTLDERDALAHLQNAFILPQNVVYLDGNSLGALPKAAKQRAIDVVETQWGQDLITSWNKHAWIDLPVTVGNKIAPLIGSHEPEQVICCDSISVNLFKLLCACISIQNEAGESSKRNKILSQRDNFPTDLYMVEGLQALLGEHHCELILCDEADVLDTIQKHSDELVAVMLTHVNFRSGYIHDLPKITATTHEHGALSLWDLAHSAGAVAVDLDQNSVDFAVGCGYKYLNGGPGAPAFIYAAKRHHKKLQQPLSGWMGHAKPFDFTPEYTPDPGIKKFLAGTPNVISMSVLDAAMEIFAETDIQAIRAKSVALTGFFQSLVASSDYLSELVLASPENPVERGSQIAYEHPHAYALCQALIAQGVIADFRAPNILRFGFSPSYLSFESIAKSAVILENIVKTQSYKEAQFNKKQRVT